MKRYRFFLMLYSVIFLIACKSDSAVDSNQQKKFSAQFYLRYLEDTKEVHTDVRMWEYTSDSTQTDKDFDFFTQGV